MSNRSLLERMKSVVDRGPNKWLTSTLFEKDMDNSRVPPEHRDDDSDNGHAASAGRDLQALRSQIQARQPQQSEKPKRPSLDLSRSGGPGSFTAPQRSDAHSAGNRDRVFAQESLSLRALKNLLIDKMDIDF